jgi:hypothetical protein
MTGIGSCTVRFSQFIVYIVLFIAAIEVFAIADPESRTRLAWWTRRAGRGQKAMIKMSQSLQTAQDDRQRIDHVWKAS